MKRRTQFNLIWVLTVLGAMLGVAASLWGGFNILMGSGIGAVIGLVLGLGFAGLPPPDREPKDLFPS